MTSIETSEEVADQPTYQARVRVAYDHPIGPVEERRARRRRGFEKNLKRNGYRMSLASHKIVGCGNATQEFHLAAKRSHFHQ